jgi:predicted HTH domain antitoxin
MRQVAVELPDDIAEKIEAGGRDLSRRALEALAADAYRSGEITAAQVQTLLGLPSRWETDAFLKSRGAYLAYDEAELEADLEAIRSALS